MSSLGVSPEYGSLLIKFRPKVIRTEKENEEYTEILYDLDRRHKKLTTAEKELAGQIPTCENIARLIWRLLEPKITRGQLDRVRLYESPDLFVDCTRNGAV